MGITTAPESIITIDCHYGGPERAAAYLIIEGGRAAFVENNTVHAVPLLLEALTRAGLRPEDVAYLIITHVHLDHAGGTGALLDACPNAVVVAHPRAERHLLEPQRLVESARVVYGAERFDQLFGTIRPVAAERIRVVGDSEVITFGKRAFTFLHTLGHAKHHMCIHDSGSSGVFTGDAFGLAYPALRRGPRPFVMCTSAPADFEPEEARRTVYRILDTGAERVYATHYGELSPPQPAAEVLLESIDSAARVLDQAVACGLAGEALAAWCREQLRIHVQRALDDCGACPDETMARQIESDIAINADGIVCAVNRIRKANAETK